MITHTTKNPSKLLDIKEKHVICVGCGEKIKEYESHFCHGYYICGVCNYEMFGPEPVCNNPYDHTNDYNTHNGDFQR